MQRPPRAKGCSRLASSATPEIQENDITLPRAFVFEVLVRATVPVLQDEVGNENLLMFAVDSGASRTKTPMDALRALLGFWNVGARPGDETP